MSDRLSIKQSTSGTLVLNHGDPAYKSSAGRGLAINSSQDIFLRLIAYLPFAEAVIIPSRHLLEGQDAFNAAVMATPLLKQGLLIPERRSGPKSFADVAQTRNLGSREKKRADYLDQHAASVRELLWSELSGTYRDILLADLASNGPFRRVVPGGLQGNLKTGLDRAYEVYEQSGLVTPEGFVSAVEQGCPSAGALARRWAMARYYLTPTQFDDVNIRQVPKEAADLLIRGHAIDDSLRPSDDLPPVEHLARQLSVGVKLTGLDPAAYCEAALRVRDEVPQARALFQKIIGQAEARELGEEVTATMSKELGKQLRERILDQPVYSLGVDLLGTGAGAAAGFLLSPLAAAGAGMSAFAGTATVKHVIKAQYDKRKRPWKLAVDRLNATLKQVAKS